MLVSRNDYLLYIRKVNFAISVHEVHPSTLLLSSFHVSYTSRLYFALTTVLLPNLENWTVVEVQQPALHSQTVAVRLVRLEWYAHDILRVNVPVHEPRHLMVLVVLCEA